MRGWDGDAYHSKSAFIDTRHSLSLIEPVIRRGDVVLDVGCGAAYVAWELERRHELEMHTVDIVDARRKQTARFKLFDGVALPVDDQSCDVVIMSFVLHHVPNETKAKLVAEVLRVVRRDVIVLEDTPRNFIDRFISRRHGRQFQKQINSELPFGFFSQGEWETWFPAHGFRVASSQTISRFARDWQQPYARSCFVLEPVRQLLDLRRADRQVSV
jgi:SAM-dependent methyltransferase